MRSSFRTAALVFSAPLIAGAVAAPAAAKPGSADSSAAATRAVKSVDGGVTRLTIAPGVAKALLGAGIRPLPKAPATASAIQLNAGKTVRYAFRITGGSLNLKKVDGAIWHSGGLQFYNAKNRKSLTVRNFRVVLGSAPKLTGYVPALNTRIAVFDLNLAKAKITPTRSGVRVENVSAKLTSGAAKGLNGALGTRVFAAGLPVGTASVNAEL